VKRQTLIRDYDEGGLRMIDLSHMQTSMAIKWITKINENGNGIWKALPRYYFNKYGPNLIIFKMDSSSAQLKGPLRTFPHHYMALTELWCNIPNKNSKLSLITKPQILWNNRNLTYRGNVTFNLTWITNDIIFVSNMLNHSKICSFENIAEKVGNNAMIFDYNIVRNAIPAYVSNHIVGHDRDFTIYLDDKQLELLKTRDIRDVMTRKSTEGTDIGQVSKDI
jgi:hypothetical protein